MWNFLTNAILRKRIPILSVILVLTLFMGYMATKVRLQYESSSVLPDKDPTNRVYKNFIRQFGQDGTIMFIGIRDTSFFQVRHFNRIYDLTDSLRNIKGVSEIVSITRLYNLVKNDSLRKFEFIPITPHKPASQAELDSIRGVIHSLPFYRGFIYNPETSAYLMALTLDKKLVQSKDRVRLIREIQSTVDRFSAQTGTEVHYSGLPYIRTLIAKKLERELIMFVILALLVSAFFLFIFFRSTKAVIFPMVIMIMSVIWALGMMALFGYRITMLTSIIPPLVIVIAVENCIFILNKYHYEYSHHHNQAKALSRVIHRIGVANLLTNAATATGFAAFTITSNKLLVEFGLIAAISIMVIYALSLTLVPIFFSFLPPPKGKYTRHIEASLAKSLIDKAVYWVQHYRNPIYLAMGILILIGIIGAFRLRTTGTIVDDISKRDPIYKDLLFFEKHFKGIMPLEITVDTKKKKGVMNLGTLNKIDRLQDSLATYPELSKPLSIVEVIKSAKQAFYAGDPAYYALPNSNELAFMADYIPTFKANKRTILNNFLDTTYRVTRVSVQMANVGTPKIDSIQKSLRPKIDSVFNPARYEVTITGSSVVFLKETNFLIRNLWESIALAVVVIALLLAFLFTSWRMILISLIPNLIPQLMTGALMGFTGIPIKPSTILIFSIALGISVDNSIQFLSRYRLQLRHTGHNIPESVISALKETGYSMIYSSTVLFFGFGIFVLSTFGGTQALGFLISFTLLVAGLLNMFVLPSMLLTLDKWSTTRAFERPPIVNIDDDPSEE
ncbi:MAG TPA: MMPL family transporter [Bacteroidales bacterium]|nr:MMPL family transporter [Bacteroidales bacterium]HPS49688.1 MMPL family transporter [Bacteroidales bacterium]